MRCRILSAVATLALLAGCGDADTPTEIIPTFNIDAGRISVSGVSSGAYMAGQLHVAHSAMFTGAGLVAGGPYGCAEGNLRKALGACLTGNGDLTPQALQEFARKAQSEGRIDPLQNLNDDRVWLFHGAKDAVVGAAVTEAAGAFYAAAAPAASLTLVNDVEAVHGFPTLSFGAACDDFAAPFLNACGYDAAGQILAAIHGPLAPRTQASGRLQPVSQPNADDALLLPEALLYVPTACANGESCGLHVAFHGCSQSTAYVDNAFVTGAGYNEWAESNRLLVLYPQVGSSNLMPANPQGCWDWWGYTGEHYATRDGAQVAAVKKMIDRLAGKAP